MGYYYPSEPLRANIWIAMKLWAEHVHITKDPDESEQLIIDFLNNRTEHEWEISTKLSENLWANPQYQKLRCIGGNLNFYYLEPINKRVRYKAIATTRTGRL